MIISYLSALATGAGAKEKAPLFLYSDMALGGGKYGLFRAGANCLFQKRHEIALGFNGYWRKSDHVPADYITNSIISSKPREILSGVVGTYAYVLYPKRSSDDFRLLLRTGVFLGERSDPDNFQRTSFHHGYQRYEYTVRRSVMTALVFQPTFVYTPRHAWGLTAGGFLILNNEVASLGFTLGVQVGNVSNLGFSWRKR